VSRDKTPTKRTEKHLHGKMMLKRIRSTILQKGGLKTPLLQCFQNSVTMKSNPPKTNTTAAILSAVIEQAIVTALTKLSRKARTRKAKAQTYTHVLYFASQPGK
jgi:hypothetical protein